MPKHIAFIIDGNGRWAKAKGMSRSMGHRSGLDNLKSHMEFVQQLGIKNLSIYCFSKQNWNRPQKEVDYLMELFHEMLDEFEKNYLDKDIRIIVSGDMEDERLPSGVKERVVKLMEETKNKTGFILNPCINYGGREEILNAVNQIIDAGKKQIDEVCFEQYLYTKDLLPLDFIIRTSGETRTSNFMPWQSTYSEWYFPKKTWPGFTKKDLIKALKIFMKRNRRYGAIKEETYETKSNN